MRYTLVAPSARAAQANLATHMTWLQARTPGMTVIDFGDLLLADSGLPTDTFSAVCRANIAAGSLAPRIREVIDHFARADRPFSWWVGPGDNPADLGAALEEAGLTAAETELAMGADLGRLHDAPPPAELRIERALTPDAIAAFAQVNAANWSPPDDAVLEFYRRTTRLLLSAECPLRLYVGYVGDRPVATAEATVVGGGVGLYNIATLEAWRRRGYGSALTLAPLREAREEGRAFAILQASSDGAGVYRRIGFSETGVYVEYAPPCRCRSASLSPGPTGAIYQDGRVARIIRP